MTQPNAGQGIPRASDKSPDIEPAHDSRVPPDDADARPGLPGLRSWPAVYLAVLACLLAYLIGLAALTRCFA